MVMDIIYQFANYIPIYFIVLERIRPKRIPIDIYKHKSSWVENYKPQSTKMCIIHNRYY